MATDAASLGVWDLDLLTNELNWSDRCREIFGVAKDASLTYQDFLERLDEQDCDIVDAAVRSALDPEGPGAYDIEYRICRPSGEMRWVSAKGRAIFGEISGNRKAVRFVGTIFDRTDQKLTQDALFQAERMAGTGRLAASIAHEINNPLEAVTNLLYILRTEQNEEQRQQHLTLAEAELARVTEITTNTLRFYRDPIGDSEVDLTTLIRSVMSIFQGRITLKNIRVISELNDITQRTAQGELRQVLVNLISNALDAMPQGGCLRIRTSRRSAMHGRPGGVSIAIADSGHGMSPHVLARLFQPFYTTKGAAGTGLGLWLSAEIARKNGFQLRLRSTRGKGTTFRIFIHEAEPTT